MTNVEKLLIDYIVDEGLSRVEAYIRAFDLEPDEFEHRALVRRVDAVMRRKEVSQYYEKRLESKSGMEGNAEIAETTLRNLATGGRVTDAGRAAAARELLKIEERKRADNHAVGFDRWKQLMLQIGAEVRCPVRPGDDEVVITMQDLVEGKAYIDLPLPARLRLLERAGAPWNEFDPDARLSELQVEILARDDRKVIVHGGSGVGKSVLGGCKAILGLCVPFFRVAIVAGTYEHCSHEFDYAYLGYLRLFGVDGFTHTRCVNVNRMQHHDMEIRTIWGSWLTTISTDREDGDALLGKEFDLIIYGEGSKVRQDIHERKAMRALNRRIKHVDGYGEYYRKTGRMFGATTPDGWAGCTSAEWDGISRRTQGKLDQAHMERCDNWLHSAYLREAACEENPAYSREAIEHARLTLPRNVFEEQYEGKRVRRTGLIYKEWDPETMVVPMPSADAIGRMRLAVGLDTGKHFSASLNGLDPDGVVWRLAEVVTTETPIQDSCESLRKIFLAVLEPVYGNVWSVVADRIELWSIDARSQHKTEVHAVLGAPISDANFKVGGSIDTMRALMAENRFRVVADTHAEQLEKAGFLWEVQNYFWKWIKPGDLQTAAKLEPWKGYDHSLDEARYGVIPLLEAGSPAGERPQGISFGDNWNRQTGLVGLGHLMRNHMRKGGPSVSVQQAYRRVHGF